VGILASISRPFAGALARRFKAALPRGGVDPVLLAVLSRLLATPAGAARLLGPAEIFLFKAALFMSGVRLADSALAGVGEVWKEDLGQRHYDPDAGVRRDRAWPQTLLLPHGFCWPVSVAADSPFELRRVAGELFLFLDELQLFPVAYERRPAYYARQTSSGVPMAHIGPHRLLRQVLVEYNATCHFFAQGNACLFCGITAERPLLRPRHEKRFAASPREIAEVVEAAYAEGVATEMQVTGGVLPGQLEIDYLVAVGRALRERLSVATVPGSQAVLAAPGDLAKIDALAEAGWEQVAFNLEVWDPSFWPAVVPGKAALLPRDGWLAALTHAAQVFGKGRVASVLVAGIEPRANLLAGVAWLADRGIYGVPIPWSPAPGSAFAGHQTPTAAWHVAINARVLDLWEAAGLPADRHSSGGLPYADLGRLRASLRAEPPLGDAAREADLRHQLAVVGALPRFD
jgi:hypothetical protein